jgi:hypothetical protein
MKINQNSDVLVMSILKKIQSELGKDS